MSNWNEKKLHPTELGMAVNKILVENFPKLFNVSSRPTMEKELDLVEEGTDDWVKVLSDFYQPFMPTIDELKGKEKAIKESLTEKTDIKCEKCGSPMVIKWGRNGRFLACSAYPECKSTRPLPEEEAARQNRRKVRKMRLSDGHQDRPFRPFPGLLGLSGMQNHQADHARDQMPQRGCNGDIVEKQTKGRKLLLRLLQLSQVRFCQLGQAGRQTLPDLQAIRTWSRRTPRPRASISSVRSASHKISPENVEADSHRPVTVHTIASGNARHVFTAGCLSLSVRF